MTNQPENASEGERPEEINEAHHAAMNGPRIAQSLPPELFKALLAVAPPTETPETDEFFNRKPSGRTFLEEVRETMEALERRARAAEAERERDKEVAARWIGELRHSLNNTIEERARLTAELAELRRRCEGLRGALEVALDQMRQCKTAFNRHGWDACQLESKISEVEFAITETAPSSPGDAWRAIGEAPKDELILLYWFVDGAHVMGQGVVHSGTGYVEAVGMKNPKIGFVLTGATHWQPLPPPPASEGRVDQ